MSHAWTVCHVDAGSLLTDRRMTDWTHTANAKHCPSDKFDSHELQSSEVTCRQGSLRYQSEPCMDLFRNTTAIDRFMILCLPAFRGFHRFLMLLNLALTYIHEIWVQIYGLIFCTFIFQRAISASGNSCFCNYHFFEKISTLVQSIVLRWENRRNYHCTIIKFICAYIVLKMQVSIFYWNLHFNKPWLICFCESDSLSEINEETKRIKKSISNGDGQCNGLLLSRRL